MLAVSRFPHERVRLMTSDGPVWVQVVSVRGRRVKLAFDAPDAVKIDREERLNPLAKAEAAPDADSEIEEQLKVLTTSPVTGEATKGAF